MSLTVKELFDKLFISKKEKSAKLLIEVYDPKLKSIEAAVEKASDITILHEYLYDLLVLKDILENTKGIENTFLLEKTDQLYKMIDLKISGINASKKGGRRRRVKK